LGEEDRQELIQEPLLQYGIALEYVRKLYDDTLYKMVRYEASY
jgi:hypothetical protein